MTTRTYITTRRTTVSSANGHAPPKSQLPLEILCLTSDRRHALVDGYLPIKVALRYVTRGTVD